VEFRAIKCNLSLENAFSEAGYTPAAFNAIPFIHSGATFRIGLFWGCIQKKASAPSGLGCSLGM